MRTRSVLKPAAAGTPRAAALVDENQMTAEIEESWQKSSQQCICPKCGKRHMMQFHWIGRGTPRKFCNSCREST